MKYLLENICTSRTLPIRLLNILLLFTSVFTFLSACTTNGDWRDVSGPSDDWYSVGEPPSHFQVTEDVLFKNEISYGGSDSELIVTERGVYVLYGESSAYLNPAFQCEYKNFARKPITKSDLIGITCQRQNNNSDVHYFYVPDSKMRKIALQNMVKEYVRTQTLIRKKMNDSNLGIYDSI